MEQSVEFDPLAPVDAVPHGEIAALRRQCPVAQTPSGYWYLTRHEDVVTAAQDVFRIEGAFLDTSGLSPDELFLPFISEPRHGRVRRVINAAIAAHRVGRIEEPLRDLCNHLLDAVVARGRAELIGAYVEPIPAAGIGFLLGLPDDDQPRFSRWADDLFKGTVLAAPEERAAREQAMQEISDYLDAEIANRASSANPPDDFITRLVNTEVAGERLSHLACRTQLIFLLTAGTETTRNLIGNMILRLARDAALLERLRARPDEIPAALEESLRLDPPIPFVLRKCTADLELGGVDLPEGTPLAFGLASANRDELVFDDPDVFDIERDNQRGHVAFGAGPHVCPGATLARLEARIAVETFVSRVTKVELEPD
jgi:cytochrome P450